MTLTSELLAALLTFGTKFGIDAALTIANGVNKPAATIDDAISALQAAKTKTAQDYLKEASTALTGAPAVVKS